MATVTLEMFNNLTKQVQVLQELVGTPLTEESFSLSSQIFDLRQQVCELREALEEARVDMAKHKEETLELCKTMVDDFPALVDIVKANIKTLEDDLIITKRAVAGQSGDAPQKIRVPEPKCFGGTRSAKELENFLWDMEQYFKAARINDGERVTITSMYLAGDAKLWWRTRMVDDASAGRPRIDTWDALKKELKDQFLPCNTSWIARDSLKRLKQTGSARDYVKEFSSLMLDIQNMSEEDKLFNFLSGLQSWAQAELRRQGVKDLPTAIAAADALADFKYSGGQTSEKKKGFQKKEGKGNDQKHAKQKDSKKEGKKKTSEGQKSKTEGHNLNKDVQKRGCFLCNGPHRMKDCPKKEKLSA